MSKDLYFSLLLDFYAGLLTDKQAHLMDLYYNEDLSLGEIATIQQMSRQGVRDSIKRGEQTLRQLDQQLAMVETSKQTTAVCRDIEDLSDEILAVMQQKNTYTSEECSANERTIILRNITEIRRLVMAMAGN